MIRLFGVRNTVKRISKQEIKRISHVRAGYFFIKKIEKGEKERAIPLEIFLFICYNGITYDNGLVLAKEDNAYVEHDGLRQRHV